MPGCAWTTSPGRRPTSPARRAALREPHLWLISLLYIGTFGSFIGFASVFPKLIADQFPAFSSIAVGSAAVSLAFLGAAGRFARPPDRRHAWPTASAGPG